MAMLGYGALAALGGAIFYANLPTKLTIGAVVPTAAYLAKAKLIPIFDEAHVDEKIAVQASSLFDKGPTMVMAVRRPGCMFCRKEAAALSTLEPDMKSAGINLVAVVHETKSATNSSRISMGRGRTTLTRGVYLVVNNELVYSHLEKGMGRCGQHRRSSRSHPQAQVKPQCDSFPVDRSLETMRVH
ncbi:hypothetical protein COOONC_27038 [Cooperia oncophora]